MTDPTPPPPPLPPAGYAPIWRDQRQIDAGHLRLLSIFHYVLSALGVLFLGFLFIHYQLMSRVFTDPKFWQNMHQRPGMPPTPNMPPPAAVFEMFKWVYLVFAGLTVLWMVTNALSGWCIARRKARTFSLVVAGLNCLHVPFGTALGVFTLVVLLRDSVREAYAIQGFAP